MGFSGGGSNTLKPHKHSSAVQDGSPLNMVNVTEGSLNAGDIVYSDGNALQRLAVGLAAQQLKVNAGATAPEWFTPAAGGASTANNLDTSGTFSTASTSLVDVTNMNITIPNTGGTNDCLIMYAGSCSTTDTGAPIQVVIIDNVTQVVSQEPEMTNVGYGMNFGMQTIVNGSGNTAKLQMLTGAGTGSLRAGAEKNSILTAFAV
jgi:hypothetical protein